MNFFFCLYILHWATETEKYIILTLFYDQNYVNLSNLKFHPLCHTKSSSFFWKSPSSGPVACFSDTNDISRNQNNCYWPLHNEPIARCKHHMQEKLVYIAAHIWKIYDFKIEVIPFIINLSTELTTVVKFEV